ncbi:SPOSA6832_04737 [Sporobolomyces salmonicolor]|uniref:SPOSA6832_04737-mRNA-1:cds n=1 Tax=Sporidiobolus salmonicolor TaxID=5005 RepID=A0A0D6ESR0_SPOSA|nr:SPOSA6832_04737 [Sporobolomyces salmonicolor]
MTDSTAEDRRSAAAARQAKILARSQERLAKITGAAKGEGRIVKPRELGSVGAAVVGGQLAEVPLLWLFVSVELVLQTTRVFLNRPSPPSILSSLLPLLSQFSPQLGLAIQTGVRYIDLFSTCLNDLAVLIFCIGVMVLVGQWKTGAGQEGWVEAAVEKGGEVLAKVTREL